MSDHRKKKNEYPQIVLPIDSSSLNSENNSTNSSKGPDDEESYLSKDSLKLPLVKNQAFYGSISSIGSANNSHEHEERSVTKKGMSNIKHRNISSTNKAFWVDIFTTFLDTKWRWLVISVFLTYFSSWLMFATIWYLILYIHGDLDEANLLSPGWKPCVTNMVDFTSTFLFSIETQQTTGYGFYHITEECPSAVITLCIQSILGVILEGLVVGLVLLKMSRAKKRTATLLFSRNAVVCKRDGELCFMFRVADMRTSSSLLKASIRAQLISTRITMEGEEIPLSQQELSVSGDGEKSNKLLLFWPTTIVHKITPHSPLYKYVDEMNESSFENSSSKFEIIVVLEGIVEATGLVTQARTSYLSSEIQWGHTFKPLSPGKTMTNVKSGAKLIDYSQFHHTERQ